MHRGAVVAVELLADVAERKIEHLPAKIYGDLARIRDVARSLLTYEVGMLDLEKRFYLSLYVLNGEVFRRPA